MQSEEALVLISAFSQYDVVNWYSGLVNVSAGFAGMVQYIASVLCLQSLHSDQGSLGTGHFQHV